MEKVKDYFDLLENAIYEEHHPLTEDYNYDVPDEEGYDAPDEEAENSFEESKSRTLNEREEEKFIDAVDGIQNEELRKPFRITSTILLPYLDLEILLTLNNELEPTSTATKEDEILKKGLKAFLDNEIVVLTEKSNEVYANQPIDFVTLTDLSFEEEIKKYIELAQKHPEFVHFLGLSQPVHIEVNS